MKLIQLILFQLVIVLCSCTYDETTFLPMAGIICDWIRSPTRNTAAIPDVFYKLLIPLEKFELYYLLVPSEMAKLYHNIKGTTASIFGETDQEIKDHEKQAEGHNYRDELATTPIEFLYRLVFGLSQLEGGFSSVIYDGTYHVRQAIQSRIFELEKLIKEVLFKKLSECILESTLDDDERRDEFTADFMILVYTMTKCDDYLNRSTTGNSSAEITKLHQLVKKFFKNKKNLDNLSKNLLSTQKMIEDNRAFKLNVNNKLNHSRITGQIENINSKSTIERKIFGIELY